MNQSRKRYRLFKSRNMYCNEEIMAQNVLTTEEFLSGIDSVICSICRGRYLTGAHGEAKHEPPLTLHCGHTFGAKCLSKWVSGTGNGNSCPTCRGLTYKKKKEKRLWDRDIEAVVIAYSDMSRGAQWKPKDKMLKLIEHKRVVWALVRAFSGEKQMLSRRAMKACICQCIWLYLLNEMRIYVQEDRDVTAHTALLEELGDITKEQSEQLTKQLSQDASDMIKGIILRTSALQIPAADRLRLARRLIDNPKPNSTTDFKRPENQNLHIAGQSVPRLLAFLGKCKGSEFISDRWDIDLNVLIEADTQVSESWILDKGQNFGQTYGNAEMTGMLASWGLSEPAIWNADEDSEADSVLMMTMTKSSDETYQRGKGGLSYGGDVKGVYDASVHKAKKEPEALKV
ncbi:uncharacterized protein KY384_003490 [Bacidia gigantensis]|uniref:uncharacterized protein n=1 Tax=Bacidia gigantensis TaxID=2732470 RepID=UPI001D0492E9|nr:uncharacterized protein KY384_003490 [Bacidia gigantensis]KAG8531854.1 hypothetical protein KY384_003490 [Bacidia gigantensis]